MGTEASTLPEPVRILVRGVNWLGDAVMTTPALARLRERFGAAHIALLASRKLEPLWAGHADIDEVLTFDPGESPWAIGRRLREKRFDAALIFPNSPRSAIECWWGRIPVRVGYQHSWRGVFLTRPVPLPPTYMRMRKKSTGEIRRLLADGRSAPPVPIGKESHHLNHYLHLGAALGADPAPVVPRLVLPAEEIRVSAKKFHLEAFLPGARERTAPGKRPVLVGLNPGAEYGPAKRWPTGSFIQAARRAARLKKIQWLVLGGPADFEMAQEIAFGIQAEIGQSALYNLAGRTSLRELMALLSLIQVLLTNDTGPMHLAAALGSRVIVPFGSTSPELTGPGLPGSPAHCLVKADVACAPCFLRDCPVGLQCMRSISAERVASELIGLMDQLED